MGKKQNNELVFNLGDKVIQFTFDDFDKATDLDRLLKIDYQNLMAEILVFPVVVNRLGILSAQMDNKVSEAKIDLAVFESKAREKFRTEWTGTKSPTVQEVEDHLITNKKCIAKRKEYFSVIKDKEIFYSVYMAAKDKSEKLNKLSLTIKSGDINQSIIQGQLNNVYFKIKEGAIRD